MKTYDWVVVGAGIAGAAIAYELARKGFAVLLLEQFLRPQNATRYSYGGISFWSGTTPLTHQLCNEGILRHRLLSEQLDASTEFRELDLLMTIPAHIDPHAAAASYAHFAIPPTLLSVEEACELEPLLNSQVIAGALTVKHGHVHPDKTAQAYIQAFVRAGGTMEMAEVLELQTTQRTASELRLTGVKTTTTTYPTANVIVCAGGLSRQLLKSSGICIRLYFTHAEMIETPQVDVQLRTLVMPANLKRFQLEAESTKIDELWDEPSHELLPPILDAGAVQFQNGSLRLGQISRVFTDPYLQVDSVKSEQLLRKSVGEILPKLANLPGSWHHCLVAFSRDRLPLIGKILGWEGVNIFSGFSNALAIIPPLAQRFANLASGQRDDILPHLSPTRFNS